MRIGGRERYAISKETGLSHDEAVALARGLLANEGYGIVTEIDLQKKLKEKLGVDKGPYTILGACNPSLADRALAAEPELGTLLPCNVIVYETGGSTRVAAVESKTLLSIVGNEALAPIAKRVREDLGRVVEGLAEA
jgi:uncharacterized protein (DUF302 family)